MFNAVPPKKVSFILKHQTMKERKHCLCVVEIRAGMVYYHEFVSVDLPDLAFNLSSHVCRDHPLSSPHNVVSRE